MSHDEYEGAHLPGNRGADGFDRGAEDAGRDLDAEVFGSEAQGSAGASTGRTERGPDRTGRRAVIAGGAVALAALGGILYAYYRPGVTFNMGQQILLMMFAAVTLGGLGTVFGALVGSIIVGIFVEVSTIWLPADLKYVGALFIMIIVLVFRPQGILGRKERIG